MNAVIRQPRTDFYTYREVLRTMPPEPYHTPDDIDCRTTANVGDIMAEAMAAAGAFAFVTGGRTACETDYLVANGETFPPSVTLEEMIAFNRRTLKPDMDETDEMRRYAAIAQFWRPKHV